jgi:DUF4097 and DUF4098 domain-containing protein YvlB
MRSHTFKAIFIATCILGGTATPATAVDSAKEEKKIEEGSAKTDDGTRSPTISQETGSLSLDKVEEIKIQVVAKETKIEIGEKNELSFVVTGRLPKSGKGTILSTRNQGNIILMETLDEKGQSNNGCNCYLTVALPASYSGSLTVKSVSGSQALKLKSVKSVRLKSVSGDVTVEAQDMEALETESVSGDVKIELTGTDPVKDSTATFDIKTTSGNVQFSSKALQQNLTTKTVSGEVTINVAEGDSFSYDLSSVSGDLSLSPNKTADTTSKTLAGKNGAGKYRVEARTTSGDISLQMHSN